LPSELFDYNSCQSIVTAVYQSSLQAPLCRSAIFTSVFDRMGEMKCRSFLCQTGARITKAESELGQIENHG